MFRTFTFALAMAFIAIFSLCTPHSASAKDIYELMVIEDGGRLSFALWRNGKNIDRREVKYTEVNFSMFTYYDGTIDQIYRARPSDHTPRLSGMVDVVVYHHLDPADGKTRIGTTIGFLPAMNPAREVKEDGIFFNELLVVNTVGDEIQTTPLFRRHLDGELHNFFVRERHY